MLMDRIIKVLTFKKEVYAEVESDESFTQTAWIIVAVVALLNSLGQVGNYETLGGGFMAALISTVFTFGGFALGAWVIATVGKAMFQADVTFDEMVRVLGLAYIWNAIGVLGILGAFVPVLLCIASPLFFVAWILSLASWFFAAQEALDLDTGKTVITLIIGMIAVFIVSAIAGTVIAVFGITTAAAAGAVFGG